MPALFLALLTSSLAMLGGRSARLVARMAQALGGSAGLLFAGWLGAMASSALAASANAKDPDLRKLVALAFTFWPPSATEKDTAERALLRLSSPEEHGDGDRVLIGKDD